MVSNLVNKILNTPIGRKIGLGVLGSGMLFNAIGTDLDVWRTFLPENYPEVFPRIRGPPGTKLELELTRNGTDTLRHSAIFDSDGAIYLETIFKDSSSIDETYNIPKGNFISTFGNNIVFPQNNQKGINNIEINVYNVKGQLVEKVPHQIQNGFVVGHFEGNGKSEGKYFFQVKNGENIMNKGFLFDKDNNSSYIPSNILEKLSKDEVVKETEEDKNTNAKDKTTIWDAKYTYIPDKINNPMNWWHQISTFYGQINSTESVHEVEEQYLTPFVPKNYVQGYVTEMMTGNPISDLPVRFVKLTERNPFGQEFKFDFDVLSETTTDVNGYYKTPEAIGVQDSVFAVIGTKDDNWMNTEYVDTSWVMNGESIPDSLDSDHNRIVYTQMDGFFSKLPMHQASDSLQISRYGDKFVNYALYPKWNEIALRDTIPDTYVTEMDAVIEQNSLGVPIDKMRNGYYISGRNNKCSEAIRNDVPFGIYFVTKEDDAEFGYNEEEINRGKEWLLQSAMVEKGLTREEAKSYADGYGGKYRILSQNPNVVSGLEPAMPVQGGGNQYLWNEYYDNPVQGYNNVVIDNADYAKTSLQDHNEFAAKKEMTSNPARGYTTYTRNINNSTSQGHRKVDQLWIPMEAKFYQKQASGDNNATMDELIGRFYGLDY